MNITRKNQRGLALWKVALVLVTIALLVVALLPLSFRRARAQASRISCASQLKSVSLASRLYANDNGDQFPFAISDDRGGSLSFAHTPQVFRHFQAMSNEIVTPKVLVCPNDRARIRATDFQTPLSNTNISYFVGLDAREGQPQTILTGDRNITGGRLTNGFLRLITTNDTLGWTKELHNRFGNIGFGDGSVQQFESLDLTSYVRTQSVQVIRLAIP
jgi:prepilin-type processing-associated H-X9-DG protein